ncbi:MAG: hypothetical protein ACRD7E_14595, partial [Bryobacteraceae bacterium]
MRYKSWILLLATCTVHLTAADLVLNGKLDDPYWSTIPSSQMMPVQQGIPKDMGGDIRVGVRAGYLCLAARLPEEGGKVLARSIGRNPVWERDALESPPVEDRVNYLLRFKSVGGTERNVSIAVNPWGAYRVEALGIVIPGAEILRAARVTTE